MDTTLEQRLADHLKVVYERGAANAKGLSPGVAGLCAETARAHTLALRALELLPESQAEGILDYWERVETSKAERAA